MGTASVFRGHPAQPRVSRHRVIQFPLILTGEAVPYHRSKEQIQTSTEQIPVLYRTRSFLEKGLSTTLFWRQQLPTEAGCSPSLCWDQVQMVFMQLRLGSMFSKAFYRVSFFKYAHKPQEPHEVLLHKGTHVVI